MKKIIYAIFVSMILSACSSSESMMDKDSEYKTWVNKLINSRSKNYKRIPIDTEQQQNKFQELLYNAYKKRISKKTFIYEMKKDYPKYNKSIKWVAKQLPK